MLSKDRYESEHEFSLNPSVLPLIDKNKPAKCKILGLKQRPLHGTYFIDSRALLDVLDQKTSRSDDSVVIDYDDEDGNEFSRRFVLTHNQNRGVSWIPDPVSLRGKTQSPTPEAQDLVILRHKLGLATAFQREQQTAEELRNENTDLKSQLAMKPTPQDLVKLQNENADLKIQLASVPNKKWPFGQALAVQKVSAEHDPLAHYKDKIRIVLTNTAQRDLHVWIPLWESAEVFVQYPFGSRFRLEGPTGWRNNDWPKDASGKFLEYSCLEVKVGVSFDCYIGLLPPVGNSIEERLRIRTPVGRAIFPLRIEGKLYEESIDV